MTSADKFLMLAIVHSLYSFSCCIHPFCSWTLISFKIYELLEFSCWHAFSVKWEWLVLRKLLREKAERRFEVTVVLWLSILSMRSYESIMKISSILHVVP